MQKLLALWWFRLIIAIIASFFFLSIQSFFSFGFIFTTFFIAVSLTIVSIFVQAMRAGSSYNAFGLQFDRFALYDVFKGLIIVILMDLIFISLGLLLGYEFDVHGNFNSFNYKTLLFFTFYIFLMAYLEEILFRGLAFQTIRERFGDVVAIIILSLFFSFAHYSNPNISTMGLINIIIAGVMLSVLYITTESLWLPISVHFFWNLNQQVLLGSNISGVNFDIQIFTLTAIGSDSSWLFGGDFGIEEGLLTIVLITILTLLSFKINKQNPYIMATKFRMKYEESRILEK